MNNFETSFRILVAPVVMAGALIGPAQTAEAAPVAQNTETEALVAHIGTAEAEQPKNITLENLAIVGAGISFIVAATLLNRKKT